MGLRACGGFSQDKPAGTEACRYRTGYLEDTAYVVDDIIRTKGVSRKTIWNFGKDFTSRGIDGRQRSA
jgi:hypothetical protein